MNDIQRKVYIINKCHVCKNHVVGRMKWDGLSLYISSTDDGCKLVPPMFLYFGLLQPPIQYCKERNGYERK